jgi:hypothetical protein
MHERFLFDSQSDDKNRRDRPSTRRILMPDSKTLLRAGSLVHKIRDAHLTRNARLNRAEFVTHV